MSDFDKIKFLGRDGYITNIPDGSVIGTYENNKCVKGSNGATNIPLPVTPLMLPEKMGVFAVYPSGRPDKRFYFVPMDMIYTHLLDRKSTRLNSSHT